MPDVTSLLAIAVALVFGGAAVLAAFRVGTYLADESLHPFDLDAWNACTTPAADGFTPFQRECERRITDVLASRGLALVNRRIEPDRDYYERSSIPDRGEHPACVVVAEVPALGARVEVLGNETYVYAPSHDFRLEAWDRKTPELHYEAVVAFVRSLPLTSSDGTA